MLNLKNTLDGYLKNVEVIGNTVQDTNNLADIRSVGDKVEGQELYKVDVVSCGKNLFDAKEFTPKTGITEYSYVDDILTMGCDGGAHRRIDYKLPNTLTHGKSYVLTAKVTVLECEGGYTPGGLCGYGYYTNNSKSYYGAYYPSNNTMRLAFVYDEQGYNVIGFHNEAQNGVTKLQWTDIQLEEGTQATSYEPYKENKFEILSPVQLEKVGGVADRIVCKDGVWGVDKNVGGVIFEGKDTNNISITSETMNTTYSTIYNLINIRLLDAININNDAMTDIILDRPMTSIRNRQTQGYDYNFCVIKGTDGILRLQVLLPKTISTADLAYQWFKQNSTRIKYQLKASTFIPLPHDQQVKLRTFAGQTNVAFNTEIAGQVKAQVPKSLGAVVNTHTEQIEMLHNALKSVLAGDMYSLATILYPEDFEQNDNTEQDIMVIPE